MSKQYRSLLPATNPNEKRQRQPSSPSSSTSSGPSSSTVTVKVLRKRTQTSIACEFCRAKKSRCDGKRPTCTPCQKRHKICVYPPDESHATALARLRSKLEVSERQNDQLHRLLKLVVQLPSDQARQVLFQFSSELNDPTLLLERVQNMVFASQQIPEIDATFNDDMKSNPRVMAMDMKALTNSLFRVSARPWTTVAGDGIVSELISSFFVWDDAFFAPFIDRESFLRDMRSNDVENAKYCSPFLVNAICASRCFTSPAAKAYDANFGQDLGNKFVNQAKRMWAMEGNRPSIPSMQALSVMFTVFAFKGHDRLGAVYRYASYNMLNRLNMRDAYTELNESERPAYSKILWGLFCFESFVAHVYSQQALVPPPTIPRCFNSPSEINAYPNSALPGHVPEILEGTCQLAEALYNIAELNNNTADPGNDQDLSVRKALYLNIVKWLDRLPLKLTTQHNFTPQTCFLQMFADEVLISILRPLHSTTLLSWATPPATVRSLLFQLSSNDIDLSKRFIHAFSLTEYTCMILCGLYNSTFILVEQLDDRRTHAAFIDTCMMVRQTAKDFPLAHFILQAAFALACQLDFSVPARAVAYIQDPTQDAEQLQDLPLGFALPQTDTMKSLLLHTQEENESDALVDMGNVLAKWSRMSIQ